MSNPLFRMDERAGDIARRVCTVMYGITILMLAAVLLYRQFVLNQSVEAFKDIANILTLNVILTPCACVPRVRAAVDDTVWGGPSSATL